MVRGEGKRPCPELCAKGRAESGQESSGVLGCYHTAYFGGLEGQENSASNPADCCWSLKSQQGFLPFSSLYSHNEASVLQLVSHPSSSDLPPHGITGTEKDLACPGSLRRQTS